MVYDEIWKPAALPTDSFAYNYQQLTPPFPTNPSCFPVWSPTCRITIHYVTIGARLGHIHQLWSLPRPTAGITDPVTGAVTYPQTCSNCHNRINPADMTVQLPAASLELDDEVSNEDALQLRAYRQMLFARPQLALVNGAVVPVEIPNPPDPDGTPVPPTIPTFSAPMAVGNARGSRFFSVMNNPTHAGMLSTAELRLLSEWLDIGAQYYNDPFPPTPQN